MTTTPNLTAEQAIAEALNDMWGGETHDGSPWSPEGSEVITIADKLRAHGMLSEGAPSEARLPENPCGNYCCSGECGEHALLQAAGVAPQADAKPVDTSPQHAKNLAESSHVAPQEPSPVASTPTVSDDSGHGGDDDRGGREDGPEDEGRSHQATVAGTPQRPSGCAECHRSEGHKMDCSHRFAAQPVLDPEKVADVLRREDWTDELWDGLPQSDRDRTWALLLEAATRISSAAKRGELT